jgi:hypothetical protein
MVPVFATVEEAGTARRAPPRPQAAVPQAETRPAGPLRLRFWGTRGSLPAPLREPAVRAKIPRCARCRARACARDRGGDRRLHRQHACHFSARHFRRQYQLCGLITGGDEYVICDLGTGVREFGNRVMAEHGPQPRGASTCSCPTCTGTTSWGFRFSPGLHPWQPHTYPAATRQCVRRCTNSNRTPVSPSIFARCRRRPSNSSPRARPDLRDRRVFRHLNQAIPRRRFLWIPLFARRRDDRLLDRLRTQIFEPRPILSVHRVLSERRCADL